MRDGKLYGATVDRLDCMKVQCVEVNRFVAVPIERVFELVCMPSVLLDTDSTGLLQSVSGSQITAVGDEAVLHMGQQSPTGQLVASYDVTIVITEFVPTTCLAWTIRAYGRPAAGHVWGYRLQPSAGGTLVTYYYDWSGVEQSNAANAYTPLHPDVGMAASLSLLERAIRAAGSDRPTGGGSQ